MPIAETITLSGLLNKAWVLLVGFMWYSKKNTDADNRKRDETLATLTTANARAELKFITESRMKDAIRIELEPYKEDQQEIKLLLRGLNTQMATLSTDMAVQNALYSRAAKRKTDDT